MQASPNNLPPPGRFALFQTPRPKRFGLPVIIKPSERPREARPGQFFLHVRSVSADGFAHLFQFAIVDEPGNVVVSVFARGRSPVEGGDQRPPLPSIWWDQLDEALSPCNGGWLIAFGRVMHGAFLPDGTREAVASLDCARARFIKVARRRGLKIGPGDVADLNDARMLIGLPPVRSPDAALRALGLRELWRWMDGV
jgi:hypothetical protein